MLKLEKNAKESAYKYLLIAAHTNMLGLLEQTRLNNPVRRKFAAKRAAGQGSSSPIWEDLKFTFRNLTGDGATSLPGPKRQAVQMPDEYLPPNKILFLQNLPENVSKDQLTALFSQYVFRGPIVLLLPEIYFLCK